MRLARDIEFENYTNGKGIRMVIWNQGCKVHCPGCHNPETWNLKDGKDFKIDYLKSKIKEHSQKHCGITLSGGDPFLQPQENKELAIYAHSLGLNVWIYSGQLFEKLKENKDALELLDDKVKEVATYRLKYPEASLLELSEIISIETGIKITKSGLYHRMNKIKDLANKIKEKEDKLKKL